MREKMRWFRLSHAFFNNLSTGPATFIPVHRHTLLTESLMVRNVNLRVHESLPLMQHLKKKVITQKALISSYLPFKGDNFLKPSLIRKRHQ